MKGDKVMIESNCTNGNADDIEKAVRSLNEFTHNWCMNCTETEKQGELVFRCFDGCPFMVKGGKCLVKTFKADNLPEYKDFGCMGDL